MTIADKQLEHHQKRAVIRKYRWRWWRCFWTRPFGHDFSWTRGGRRDYCGYCGKPYRHKDWDSEHLLELQMDIDDDDS